MSNPMFGGRLTLVPGQAHMVGDQVAKRVVYYAPCSGDSIPMAQSGSVSFLSDALDRIGLSIDLGGEGAWGAGTIHDVFAVFQNNQLRLATRQWDVSMFATEEQITGGSTISSSGWTTPDAAFDGNTNQSWSQCARLFPAAVGMNNFIGRDFVAPTAVSRIELVAANNNGLVNTYTGAAMIKAWGSNDGVDWHMLGYFYADCSVSGNTNSFSINVSNRVPYDKVRIGIDPALSNASINIAELKFFKDEDPVTRRLTLVAGVLVNDAPMPVRLGVNETSDVCAHHGVYLGTLQIDPDAPGRVTAHAEYGPSRMFNIWNAHNRRQIVLRAGVITPNASNYSLTNPRWSACQNASFSLSALVGLAEENVSATFYRGAFINAVSAVAMYECGIGVDTTSAFSGKYAAYNLDHTGQTLGNDLTARLTLPKYAGSRKLIGIERGLGLVHPSVDQRNTVLEASWFG